MSGSFCSAALISWAAVAGSLCEYWTPRYVNLGSALTASSKPLTRASVVEMPGSTDMTMTLPPLGLSCLIASKAAFPPPSLSEAIAETAIEGSFSGGVDQDDLDALARQLPPGASAWP